ncbi:uncharacterized protein involved in response to NO [Oceanospirillum multiglobuliferum]|uniref:NnrS family protein n=1 Tax=Oceanospirillum multiglobuliferum TaxID=64969 RepID=A0A1T4SKW0_9GAMM|nr:NnrS family protein [Oceanospirillum multiglobuliferum]OPX54190.1 hypothetical protein BTE48_15450 [Oceanospirillum multiglobuliferum]SKA28930.1 uncharacterized protein involved in response to NO [Oceanospirillum multiglobuliferum]
MSAYSASFRFSYSALFSVGFRPFFLGGSFFSVVLMLLWVLQLRGIALPNYYSNLSAILWHSHELIFGFTSAIISGFLLTAVRNWTGQNTLQGHSLALVFAVWVLGRILPFTALPNIVIALVDLAFFPLLMIAIGKPIIKSAQLKNMGFVIFCGLFFLMNLLVHFDVLGITQGMSHIGIYGALNLVVLVMLIIGGRVIPFFSEKALPNYKGKRITWIEQAVIPVAVILFLNDLWQPMAVWANVLSGLLAALLLLRVGAWFDRALLKKPLLWILHLGYLFIAIGFFLRAFGTLSGISPYIYVHALTTGAIGLLTLGMMSRVALGHTGRALILPKPITIAFFLMTFAVLARVVLMAISPKPFLYDMAGSFWMIAFALYFVIYLPYLISPRVDA